MSHTEDEQWTDHDVVEAIWESTDKIVGAVDRLRRTVVIIALIPIGLWLLAMVLGALITALGGGTSVSAVP